MNRDEEIAIDYAHTDLIYGLIRAQKPKRILEIGYGSGRTTTALLNGLEQNLQNCTYVLVDNWLDFKGKQPFMDFSKLQDCIKPIVITSNEKDFVMSSIGKEKFDFIVSDADHQHTHEWFWDVYKKLLNPGGILIYHDVDGTYEGLSWIRDVCINWGSESDDISAMIFDKSSRPDERCERGLLVIFKREE